MSNKAKLNDIQFNLAEIGKLDSIEALKAQGAASHLDEANANATYEEAWKQAQELKAKPPVVKVKGAKKAEEDGKVVIPAEAIAKAKAEEEKK